MPQADKLGGQFDVDGDGLGLGLGVGDGLGDGVGDGDGDGDGVDGSGPSCKAPFTQRYCFGL